MIVKAREIKDEHVPKPHGPFVEIDLDKATDLGLSVRWEFKERTTLLARVDGKTYQVSEKNNEYLTNPLLDMKMVLPRPRPPCHVRWSSVPTYTRDQEQMVQRIISDKYASMTQTNEFWATWDKYLKRNGMRRALASWTSLGYSMVIADPQEPRSHRIFLTRDQAEKILVLGMP